jgi:hypothetical protein
MKPKEVFLVVLADPRTVICPEGLFRRNISNDTIGNRARDIQSGSAVPQPTAPLFAPVLVISQSLVPKGAVPSGWKRPALH